MKIITPATEYVYRSVEVDPQIFLECLWVKLFGSVSDGVKDDGMMYTEIWNGNYKDLRKLSTTEHKVYDAILNLKTLLLELESNGQ